MYVFVEVIKLCVLGNGEVVGVDVGELCTHAGDAVLQQLCQERHTVFRSLRNTSLVSTLHRTRTLHCLPCLASVTDLQDYTVHTATKEVSRYLEHLKRLQQVTKSLYRSLNYS